MELTNQLPTHILNHLLHNEEFCRRVVPYLKKEYFEGTHKTVFDLITKFVAQHNKLPTSKVLELELRKINAPEDVLNNASRLISEIKDKSEINNDYLISEAEKWCKERAVYLAIMDSIQIIDGKDKERGEGSIPEILQSALGVSFDQKLVMTILIIQIKDLSFIIMKKIAYHLTLIILIKLQKVVYQIKHLI